ncbi:hypothetical protein AX15_004714 [Amanita polypyramis BW_CC]|nr:hypothetical protein AX15_004714 [Amanita polypyramis BW_CC]
MSVPKGTRAIVLQCSPEQHDTVLAIKPIPTLKEGEVLVKMAAAGFNYRDVWIKTGKYLNIVSGNTLGSDGIVIASSNLDDSLLNKRVFLTPSRGWVNNPDGPESDFGVLGGGPTPPIGTFSEYVAVERDQVIPSPEHLDDVQIAAWPLAGVTAWRATMIKGKVSAGHNVLITGIGGGVAITALQLCVARGANVYVTSGSEDKIRRAINLGAKGGANYKDDDWSSQIASLLARDAKESGASGVLDVVIDSSGGDIMTKVGKSLKQGGSIVCYGMTVVRGIPFTIREVLRNQHLIGSTMGSLQDLLDATAFISEHRIVPIVSHVIDGLENTEKGFELMLKGDHFGKVVIKICDPSADQQQRHML